jgi:hypothetical protein
MPAAIRRGYRARAFSGIVAAKFLASETEPAPIELLGYGSNLSNQVVGQVLRITSSLYGSAIAIT